MAASVKPRRVSQPVGKVAGKRVAESTPVRRNRAGRKATSPGFGARLYTLNFSNKPGTEVVAKQYGAHLLADLIDGYSHYHQIVKGEKPVVGPGEELTITSVREKFDELIGDAEHNLIRDDDGNYRFVIYQACDYDWGWYAVPVKPMVQHLAKTNQEVHNLLIQFIKCFTQAVCIDCWWDYTMENAQDWLEENIDQMVAEGENREEYTEQLNCLADYKAGEAATYEKLIQRAIDFEPQEFKLNLESCGIEHPLIPLMIKGCDLASEGTKLPNFEYQPDPERDQYGEYQVQVYYTMTFIWDAYDYVTEQQEEWMNNEASNGGVQEPYSTLTVTPQVDKPFDRSTWPIRMQKYIDELYGYINTITKNENNNERSPAGL